MCDMKQNLPCEKEKHSPVPLGKWQVLQHVHADQEVVKFGQWRIVTIDFQHVHRQTATLEAVHGKLQRMAGHIGDRHVIDGAGDRGVAGIAAKRRGNVEARIAQVHVDD